ncbi:MULTISPECIES: hypothetical protein, partial [unclassified Desulfovibrio]|uniref:hypothetical protein n=1 Tax=unclassified Desulfovibrio TaxID=2593640 RepID=UPI00197E65A0
PSMGGVMGDATRQIYGHFEAGNGSALPVTGGIGYAYDVCDCFAPGRQMALMAKATGIFGTSYGTVWFYSGLVVPTGAANVPRSWGSLACAYFGQPATA